MLNFLTSLFAIPTRNVLSVGWAMLNNSARSTVTPVGSWEEADATAKFLGKNYKPDLFNGALDLTEHPQAVQFHLDKGSLHLLSGLDCDDVATFMRGKIRNIAKKSDIVMLIDAGLTYSHCVCTFSTFDGREGVLDVNGLTWLNGKTVRQKFSEMYPKARYGSPIVADDPFYNHYVKGS